jgi:glycosyltransferase involved in cell wall biosynthesis
MFVSIIIPVFNVEKYIARCFNSIIKQTYQNIEIIFIDDCSHDKSYEILNELIHDYSGPIHIYLLRHEINKGHAEVRNIGIKKAIGEYIYHLDSDDEITETCIESLVSLALKYKNVDIVQGNAIRVPAISSEWYDLKTKKFPEYTNDRLWLKKHFFMYPRIPITVWNKLIRKDFIEKNNLYCCSGIIHEDNHWMFFAAKKISSMSFTNIYCYIHYISDGSIMDLSNTRYKDKSLMSSLFIIEEIITNMDIEIAKEEKKEICNMLYYNALRINPDSDKQIFLQQCRRLIGIMRKDALRTFNIFRYVGLCCLYLPYPILCNSFIKKIIYYLIRLSFVI